MYIQSARTVDKAQKLVENSFGNSAISTSLSCLEGGNCPRFVVVGSRGFEPRTSSAPGWYPRPLQRNLNQDTRIASSDTLTRLRPHETQAKVDEGIINTLLENRQRGLSEDTLRSISYSLRQISKNADLENPVAVKEYIADAGMSNASKAKLVRNYDYYCKTNGIKWSRPRYKWERKTPLIPSTANVDKIISASTPKYATIFTILKETGLEAHELATVTRKDIDAERGIISAQGCKGHNSRVIKLKAKTAEMLRHYLQHYTGNKPFPRSKAMSDIWRRTRNKLAQTLNDPDIKAIPMRNLRHYYACHLYDKTKDILLVKQMLGHKKLETTIKGFLEKKERAKRMCERVGRDFEELKWSVNLTAGVIGEDTNDFDERLKKVIEQEWIWSAHDSKSVKQKYLETLSAREMGGTLSGVIEKLSEFKDYADIMHICLPFVGNLRKNGLDTLGILKERILKGM